VRVEDFQALGKRLAQLLNAGNWNKDHAIVVETVRATKATIITSLTSGAQAKFAVDVNTPIKPTVMANLSTNSSLLVEKELEPNSSIGFKGGSRGYCS
jgi:hypothetical protein